VRILQGKLIGPPLALVLLCSFLFLYRLGDRDLTSSHEARAAQNAQTLLEEGDWTLPQLFDRRVEMQKPPLYYWLVAFVAELCGGVEAWAVRLPAALSAMGCVTGLYLYGLLRGRPLAGFVAAVILATSWHFTWLARVGRIDMPLTLAVTIAVGGFYLGRCGLRENAGRGAWGCFLLAYLAVAAGLLLKGPVALVLPATVILASLVANRWAAGREGRSRWSWIHDFGVWWGLPLVALIAVPWYVLAAQQTRGDFLRDFLWHHNLDRGLAVDGELTAHPWWLYGPRLLGDLAPWVVLLPPAVWYLLRQGRWRRDPAARLGLVWLLSLLVLLSCLSFKRADYLLPAYPGVALLLGCVAERWWRESGARPAVVCWAAGVVGVYALAWWVYLDFIPRGRAEARPTRQFAAEIRARTDLPVLFFRAEDHVLAFHVGRPVDSLVEWENLDWWLRQPLPIYVVMPESDADAWCDHLKNGRLEEVTRMTRLTDANIERPLVLLRTRPAADGPAPRS
jgi:4-amino-4-deoxy-L-arabinose transferase-like glycosyltransferase